MRRGKDYIKRIKRQVDTRPACLYIWWSLVLSFPNSYFGNSMNHKREAVLQLLQRLFPGRTIQPPVVRRQLLNQSFLLACTQGEDPVVLQGYATDGEEEMCITASRKGAAQMFKVAVTNATFFIDWFCDKSFPAVRVTVASTVTLKTMEDLILTKRRD